MSIQQADSGPGSKEERDDSRIVIGSLVVSVASFVLLFLLAKFSSNQQHVLLAEFLTIIGCAGLGVALLGPLYARENKVLAIIVTMVYALASLFAGSFVVAIVGWTIYSNGQ